MARNQSPVFNKGVLKLDRVKGVRKDNGNKFIDAPLKKSTKFPIPDRAKQTQESVTKDGYKKN
jgi:hypothetical protein